jgi:hypothetical protein
MLLNNNIFNEIEGKNAHTQVAEIFCFLREGYATIVDVTLTVFELTRGSTCMAKQSSVKVCLFYNRDFDYLFVTFGTLLL